MTINPVETLTQVSRKLVLILLLLLPALTFASSSKESEREKKQYELDAACEVARQKILIPEKQKYIEECVAKEQRPDRESCERFYADYGNDTGGRAALYYDLPECVKAFEYRESYRKSD